MNSFALKRLFGRAAAPADEAIEEQKASGKQDTQKRASISNGSSSSQPNSDPPSGTGAQRAGSGASAAPEQGSTTMPSTGDANAVRRVAFAFTDNKHARVARRLYQEERYGRYIGFPDIRTIVIGAVDQDWFSGRLVKEGYAAGPDFKVSRVLQMGELSASERSEVRQRRKAENSTETIKKLLAKAKAEEEGRRKAHGIK